MLSTKLVIVLFRKLIHGFNCLYIPTTSADFFIDFMMSEELDLEVPDDPWGPTKDGVWTFVSFLLFGSVPMWAYGEPPCPIL